MQERADHKKLRSYLLAVEDTAFLQRDELRPLRLALEFNKVDLVLTDMGIKSTVVVFGSSRILSPEQAEEKLVLLRNASARPESSSAANSDISGEGESSAWTPTASTTPTRTSSAANRRGAHRVTAMPTGPASVSA